MTLKTSPIHIRSSLSAVLLGIMALTSACGPKDTVEDNESDSGTAKVEPRSRLTGGSANSSGVMSYCRLPLDLGTIVDPRRAGLTQTVLTTQIDGRCANYQEVRVNVKTKQRITLVGKFACRNGTALNEQICTGATQDIINPQKNSVSIAVVPDGSIRQGDLEASIEFM